VPIFKDFQSLAIVENLFTLFYFNFKHNLLIKVVIFYEWQRVKGKGFHAFGAVFIG